MKGKPRGKDRRSEPEETRHFSVSDAEAGGTLAQAVRGRFGGTWGEVRRLIAARRVQVNGNVCLDPARRLTAGEVVHLLAAPAAKPPAASQIGVAYMDDSIVVLEKPAGVTSVRHRAERGMHHKRRQLQPTLEDLAPEAIAREFYRRRHAGDQGSRRRKPRSAAEIEEIIRRAAYQYRVIPVHRLDRDTSGLILFARTQPAAIALGKMFRKHVVDRRYLAVVLGDCPAQTFGSYLLRDRGDGIRGSAPVGAGIENDESRRAVTHVRPVQRLAGGKYTVLECKLETGRTHQIRIHLAEAGHMICGERMYNRSLSGKVTPDPSNAPRQALHAGVLRFEHPLTGEPVKLQMPLPPDLANWLRKLSSAS